MQIYLYIFEYVCATVPGSQMVEKKKKAGGCGDTGAGRGDPRPSLALFTFSFFPLSEPGTG